MDTPTILSLWQLVAILLFINWLFSIWTIFDISKSQFTNTQKLMWVVISILAPFGAFVYLFIGRKQKPLLQQ